MNFVYIVKYFFFLEIYTYILFWIQTFVIYLIWYCARILFPDLECANFYFQHVPVEIVACRKVAS